MARAFNLSVANNVQNATPPNTAGYSAITIAAWVNFAGISSSLAAIAAYNSLTIGMWLTPSNTISSQLGGSTLTGVGNVTNGVWHHIAVTGVVGSPLISYQDGVSLGSPSGNVTMPAGGSFWVGGDSASELFNGAIADVAVWNAALSSSDIAKLAAGWRPKDVNSANLQIWWPLGGGSPDPDDSGNNNNGTVTGTVQCDGPNQIRRGARSFNGSGDTISATAINPNGFSSLTISAWFNPIAAFQNFATVAAYDANFGMYLLSSGVNRYLISSGGGNVNQNGSVSLSRNTWYHTALTASAGIAQGYINGATDAASFSYTGAFTSESTINFGNAGGLLALGGAVADIAVWNTALSAANIAKLAAGVRPINVNSANLQGWWPLDSYGATENDQSGNANNGTVTGTTSWLGPPYTWRLG